MSNLKGKLVLITGSSKGISAPVAKDIAGQGAKAVINYASSEHVAHEVLSFINRTNGTTKK